MTENILVVEDDIKILDNMSSLLEDEGYNCIKAKNGAEALEKLEKEKVDLIISDIMMPGLDGYGLFEKVQSQNDSGTIPFILITAKTSNANLRKGMNMGVDDYLTKPFAIDDLMNAVRVRLSKKHRVLKEIDKLRDQIVKYVPHELRTPLLSIIGYSDLLYKEYDSLKKYQILEMLVNINKAGSRLFERLEKFLILAELEIMDDHQSSIREKESNLYKIDEIQVFDSMTTSLEINERLNDISFSLQECTIGIVENHFELIMKEIVSNACKFSDPDTRIIINGKIKENYYVVRIFDTGLGMSKKEINKLGAFQQFNREQYQQVGNGLGLYVVQRLLRLANGSLTITSHGKKVFVKIFIPLHCDVE